MGYSIPHHQRKILKYGINKWPVDMRQVIKYCLEFKLEKYSTHKLAISIKAFQTWKLYLYVRNIYNDYCNT